MAKPAKDLEVIESTLRSVAGSIPGYVDSHYIDTSDASGQATAALRELAYEAAKEVIARALNDMAADLEMLQQWQQEDIARGDPLEGLVYEAAIERDGGLK